jgi:hypothetical protein
MWTVERAADKRKDEWGAELAAAVLAGRRSTPASELAAAAAAFAGDAGLLGRLGGRPKQQVTREQALAMLAALPLIVRVRTAGTRVVDGRSKLTPPSLLGANPFTMFASPEGRALLLRPDRELVAADGRARAGGRYVLDHDGELELLEDALERAEGRTLHVAVRSDVASAVAAILKQKTPLPPALEHGLLDRFFPFSVGGGANRSSTPSSHIVAHADASLKAAQEVASGSRAMPRVRAEATLNAVSARLPRPPTVRSNDDASLGSDMLYELFASFKTSDAVPCVKYFDGTATTLKMHAQALKAGLVPPTRARLWAAPIIARASSRQKPFLQAYVSVGGERKFATLAVHGDLSAHVHAGGFGVLGSAEAGGSDKFFYGSSGGTNTERSTKKIKGHHSRQSQVAAIAAMAATVDRLAVSPLQAILDRSDTLHTLPRVTDHVAVGKMALVLQVNGGDRTPTPAQIAAAVLGRMSAFFSVVSEAQGGGRLTLAYRRARGAGRRERASLAVRLMASRPRNDVVTELISTFGMGPDEAVSFYATHSPDREASDRDPDSNNNAFGGDITYRMETIPIIRLQPSGRLGFSAEVLNVTNFAYVDRIAWLMRLLVAEATSSGSGSALSRLPGPPDLEKLQVATKTSRRSRRRASKEEEGYVEGYGDRAMEQDAELDALIEDEIGALVPISASPQPQPSADSKRAEAEQPPDADEDMLPEQYMLSMLKRSDMALFRSPGNEYSTDCAANTARQPVVVTREELARIDREFPGAHTGAIVGYGSTPELAERNAYICPKVWCPRSHVALNAEQFKKLGNKCPYKDIDEQPILFDSDYFAAGRERHAGMLDARKHPQRLCMPCCFLKKAQRIDQCPGARIEGLAGEQGKTVNDEKQDTNSNNSGARYIRGDVAPLEEGRYGMLPISLSRAIGTHPSACGNRDDGSGQIKVHSQCFVRRGVRLGPQPFLECAARVLEAEGATDASSLAALVAARLSAADYVTLEGGRIARELMDGFDPTELIGDPMFRRGLAEWLDLDAEYSKRRFKDSVSLVAAAVARAGWASKDHTKHGTIEPKDAPFVLREALVRASMLKYVERLSDLDAAPWTHDDLGLLDLFSRPLPWLNPHRVNLLLLERARSASAPSKDAVAASRDELRVLVVCPRDDPSARWRLSDPVAILMRQGPHYEPVVHVSLDRKGVHEVSRFTSDAHPRLSAAVRQFLASCGSRGRERDRLAAVASALAVEGRPAKAQVVDCFFRAVGLVASDDTFVPLPTPPAAPLVGAAGSALSLIYVSDVGRVLRPKFESLKEAEALFERLAAATRIPGLRPVERLGREALRLENGGVVPVRSGAIIPGYLEHLNALVLSRPSPDERSTLSDARVKQDARAWELRMRVVRHVRADVELTAQFDALRSSFHPLPLDSRRTIAMSLVDDVLKGKKRLTGDSGTIGERAVLVDALLLGQRPWSLRRDDTRVDDDGGASLVLTDYDVASGALELALAAGSVAVPTSSSDAPSQHSSVPLSPSSQALIVGEDDTWNDNKDGGKQGRRPPPAPRPLALPLDEAALHRALSTHQQNLHQQHPDGGNVSGAHSFSWRDQQAESSHRSRVFRSQLPSVILHVDVYLALHLAHRALRSDAPSTLQDAVRVVQNAVLEAASSRRASASTGIDAGSTLYALTSKRGAPKVRGGSPWDAAALVDAVAWRRPAPGQRRYVSSQLEIETLSRFLGVDVAVVSAPKSSGKSSKSSKSSKSIAMGVGRSPKWLRDVAAEQRAKRPKDAAFVLLVHRADGEGHDLVLAPAPEAGAVKGAGHTLAFWGRR